MAVERCATEADLNDSSHLEQVGDTIWSTIIGISHCPFCGAKLEPSIDQPSERKSHFIHIDHSDWYAKVE